MSAPTAPGAGGSQARRDALVAELIAARDAFMAAVGDVDPDLLTAPGLLEEWSARDLVAHVAFWPITAPMPWPWRSPAVAPSTTTG